VPTPSENKQRISRFVRTLASVRVRAEVEWYWYIASTWNRRREQQPWRVMREEGWWGIVSSVYTRARPIKTPVTEGGMGALWWIVPRIKWNSEVQPATYIRNRKGTPKRDSASSNISHRTEDVPGHKVVTGVFTRRAFSVPARISRCRPALGM